MEDILKILFVVGILLYEIVRRIRKEDSGQAASLEEDLPEPEDIPVPLDEPDATCVFTPEEEEKPADPLPPTPKPQRKKLQTYQPLPDAPATPPTPDITAAQEDEYRILSAEEARKAIIWGEILQRKY